MKDEFQKFFGHLVLSASKNTLMSNMSKFQIGTKPGHRAQEHIFAIKSVMSLSELYDKPIILNLYDISKFFDSECLSDCMNELYKSNLKGKLYRLIYQLNKETIVQVNTPVGMTEQVSTGEGVGQGTIDGAVISAVNLDKGIQDFFASSEEEMEYGGLKLGPIIFQDDVARLASGVKSAQAGNDRLECLAETKLLHFNSEKSCYLVLGSGRRKQELLTDLARNPLKLCNKIMKQEFSAKYLGDFISEKGLSDSVSVTVAKRKGMVIRAMYEIRSIVDDCRSNVVGGITVGLEIWEIAVLPMLLNNAECWTEIAEKTVEELEKLQLQFLKTLLGVGSGCPNPFLISETGFLLMEFRILQKKNPISPSHLQPP